MGDLEGLLKIAYPQEWPGIPTSSSVRAQNRPPLVPIRYEGDGSYYEGSVNAYHQKTGEHLGKIDWNDFGGYGPTIDMAHINNQFHGKGVGYGILDHIRENYSPDLKHSDQLSRQGRAFTLSDRGATRDEWNKAFNTRPYDQDESEPWATKGVITPDQQAAHDHLGRLWDEEEAQGLHNKPVRVDPHGGYDPDAEGEPDSYGWDEGDDSYGDEDEW